LTFSQAFNSVAAHDSFTATNTMEATLRLLQESRADSKALARLVSIVTLLFLPGTFISVNPLFWMSKIPYPLISHRASSAYNSLTILLEMTSPHRDGLSRLRSGSFSQ